MLKWPFIETELHYHAYKIAVNARREKLIEIWFFYGRFVSESLIDGCKKKVGGGLNNEKWSDLNIDDMN